MGAGLRASCSNCSFIADGLMVGGGMRTFETYCVAPALCESCGAFSVLNYLEDDPRCPTCRGTVRFYSDPALQEPCDPASPVPREVFSWNVQSKHGPLVLLDVASLCPQCRQKSLRFVQMFWWD